jgi:hypothetical protein
MSTEDTPVSPALAAIRDRRAKIEARITAHLGHPLSETHLAHNDRVFSALEAAATEPDPQEGAAIQSAEADPGDLPVRPVATARRKKGSTP